MGRRTVRNGTAVAGTLLLAAVIYAEQVTTALGAGVDSPYLVAYLVYTDRPVVAWLLAPLFHGSTGHFLSNALAMLFFGGVAAAHLRTRLFVPLLVATAYVPLAVQAAVNVTRGGAPLVVGCSGAIYGLVGFLVVHVPLAHRGQRPWRGGGPRSDRLAVVAAVAGVLAVAATALMALSVVRFDPRVGPLVHLTGAVLGAAVAAGQRALGSVPCESTGG